MRNIVAKAIAGLLLLARRKLRNRRIIRKRQTAFIETSTFVTPEPGAGYGNTEILERVQQAVKKVMLGDAKFERDSVTFSAAELEWPLWGLIGWCRVQGKPLRILDFGGSLGSKFLQLRPFLDESEIEWRVVEQQAFVDAGNALFSGYPIGFYSSIAGATEGWRPSLVYVGSALQYLEDPFGTLTQLSSLRAEYFLLDKTPIRRGVELTANQRVSPDIYAAEYPMRIFSKTEVTEHMSEWWDLLSIDTLPASTTYTDRGNAFSWLRILWRASE